MYKKLDQEGDYPKGLNQNNNIHFFVKIGSVRRAISGILLSGAVAAFGIEKNDGTTVGIAMLMAFISTARAIEEIRGIHRSHDS